MRWRGRGGEWKAGEGILGRPGMMGDGSDGSGRWCPGAEELPKRVRELCFPGGVWS